MERIGQLPDGRMFFCIFPKEAAAIGDLIKQLADAFAPVLVENGEAHPEVREYIRRKKVKKLQPQGPMKNVAPRSRVTKSRDKICANEQCKAPFHDDSKTNVRKWCDKCTGTHSRKAA